MTRCSFSGSCALPAVIALFFSIPVFSDDYSAYIDAWEAGNRAFRVLGVPSEILPEGIDNLDLLIIGDSLDNGSDLAIIGFGRDTLCFGTVPFDMFLNYAKTYASFNSADSLIVVSSEYPSRATRCNASYAWVREEQALVPIETWISDRSSDLLASADSLLEIGEIRQAADSILAMMYGWAYYDTAELSCRFLRAAIQASKDAPDEEALGFYDDAVYAFDIIQYDDTWFISFDSLDEFLQSEYSEYIEADELADILHDYAKIFRENDYVVESVFDRVADILEGKELE